MSTTALKLRPLHQRGLWTIEFNDSVVSLCDHEQVQMMAVPRDDAPRYIHVQRDLLRGWTVSFEIMGGLKTYTFACNKADLSKLLDCLPHKSDEEISRELGLNGIAIALLGALLLLLPGIVSKAWGAILLATALASVVSARRNLFLLNGVVLFAAGLSALFKPPESVLFWSSVEVSSRVLATCTGIALVCWSIHQFSMLGPAALLRVARTRIRQVSSPQAKASPLIAAIARCAISMAIPLLLYSAALLLWQLGLHKGASLLHTVLPGSPDIVACSILGLLSLTAGMVLKKRGKSSYVEAKTTLQMVSVMLLLAFWGGLYGIMQTDAPAAIGHLVTNGLRAFVKPHVWASFLVLMLVLNKLFGRAVDRELRQDED